tara:strand:+ start:626 stop:790 length:165 start_codon:yes stop_codon:yes gene_type:complete
MKRLLKLKGVDSEGLILDNSYFSVGDCKYNYSEPFYDARGYVAGREDGNRPEGI